MKKIILALVLAFSSTLVMGADVKQPVPVKSVVVVKAEDVKFELPSQKIEGAEVPIDLGEVIMLNISKIEKVPTNLVSYTVEWKVFDKGVEKKFFKTNDANGIFFGSGVTKRKILVFASVSYLYVVKDGDKFVEAAVKSQFLTVTVDIGGGNEPDPVPNPDPDPTFPDGTYKLSAKSYSLAKDKVVGDKRKEAATELSKSFSAQAAKIAAGNELLNANDIKKVLEETTVSNREALKRAGVSIDVWNDFFVSLQEEVFNLYSSGKLKTKNEFSVAWREISEGLSKVK